MEAQSSGKALHLRILWARYCTDDTMRVSCASGALQVLSVCMELVCATLICVAGATGRLQNLLSCVFGQKTQCALP